MLPARLGLAAGIAYAAPVLTSLGAARASSFSASFSGRPPRAPVRRRVARLHPEIVVAVPRQADVDRIAALGYEVLSRDDLGIVVSAVARFRLPANRNVDQARPRSRDLSADRPSTRTISIGRTS